MNKQTFNTAMTEILTQELTGYKVEALAVSRGDWFLDAFTQEFPDTGVWDADFAEHFVANYVPGSTLATLSIVEGVITSPFSDEEVAEGLKVACDNIHRRGAEPEAVAVIIEFSRVAQAVSHQLEGVAA